MNRWSFGRSLGLVTALAVAVSACGTAGTSAAGQPVARSTAPAAPPGSAAAAPAGPRGASGTVAALSTSNLQVQNPRTGQVTVTFTPSTSFTRTVAATAADLVVGDCALASSAAAPTGSPAVPGGPVTATSVMITRPGADGGCSVGGPGGGARTAGRGRGAPAAGKLISISGSGFVLQTSNATRGVTTTPATTYSKTVATDHSALAVGQCVTAVGPSDDTGTVAASSISIRPSGPQGCQGGFGGPGRGHASR